MRSHRHEREHQRQTHEYQRLDPTHEYLKQVEGDGRHEDQQERDHDQDDLTGDHVAEEAEGEADEPDEVAHDLQHADEEVDGVPEAEELLEVAEPLRLETPHLDEDERDDRERQRQVDVRAGRAQEVRRHVVRAVCLEAHRRVDGQERHPRVERHEDEHRGQYREEGPPVPLPNDPLDEAVEGLEQHLDGALHAPRHERRLARPEPEDQQHDDRRQPGREQRVGDRESADREHLLRREVHLGDADEGFVAEQRRADGAQGQAGDRQSGDECDGELGEQRANHRRGPSPRSAPRPPIRKEDTMRYVP